MRSSLGLSRSLLLADTHPTSAGLPIPGNTGSLVFASITHVCFTDHLIICCRPVRLASQSSSWLVADRGLGGRLSDIFAVHCEGGHCDLVRLLSTTSNRLRLGSPLLAYVLLIPRTAPNSLSFEYILSSNTCPILISSPSSYPRVTHHLEKLPWQLLPSPPKKTASN